MSLLRAAPALMLLTLVLSGCVGDDVATLERGPRGADAALPTAETGAITGQVITVDLEVLVDIEVGLTNRTGGLVLTTTDTQGRYTFNDVRPGQYRVQVADDCCRIRSFSVTAVAGQVSQVNIQLERLTSVELRVPYVVTNEWNGFLACGFGIGGQSDDRCADADANHEILHRFNVTEGLQEMAIGMDWVPSAQSVGGEMRLDMVGFCTTVEERTRCERYFLIAGPPPLVTHVTNGNADNSDKRFENINGFEDMRYEVAMAGVSFAYQQEFTIHWSEFYNHNAPIGYNPIPDG